MALSYLLETSFDCLQYDLHTILKYSNFLLMLNTICRNHYVISIKYYSLFTSLSRVYQLLFLHFPPFYIEKAYYYLFLCCPKIFTKDGIGKSKKHFIKDCATPKRNRQRKFLSTRNIPPSTCSNRQRKSLTALLRKGFIFLFGFVGLLMLAIATFFCFGVKSRGG